jgi:hypothetical protein
MGKRFRYYTFLSFLEVISELLGFQSVYLGIKWEWWKDKILSPCRRTFAQDVGFHS